MWRDGRRACRVCRRSVLWVRLIDVLVDVRQLARRVVQLRLVM